MIGSPTVPQLHRGSSTNEHLHQPQDKELKYGSDNTILDCITLRTRTVYDICKAGMMRNHWGSRSRGGGRG